MPNHITNYVRIAGDKNKLAELKKKTIKISTAKQIQAGANEVEFDFNGIVKMPKELLDTVSPVTIVNTQAKADKENASYKPSPISGGQTIKAISIAEQDRRLKEYGSVDWYDWSLANWGTKWGGYNVTILRNQPEELCLQFQTAWGTPTPIFNKLLEMGLTVDCYWVDEDPSNEGSYGEPHHYFDIYHSVEVELM